MALRLRSSTDIDHVDEVQRQTLVQSHSWTDCGQSVNALALMFLALNSAAALRPPASAVGNPWRRWRLYDSRRTDLDNLVISGPSHVNHKGGRVFGFGNYETYYQDRNVDARVETVKHWFDDVIAGGQSAKEHAVVQPFNGLRILDIGCNSGRVTAEIAKAAKPDGRVLGIDIDTGLIGRACQQWHDSNLLFDNMNVMDITLYPQPAGRQPKPKSDRGMRILEAFVREKSGLLAEADSPAGQFNLIFAFSVTKWIHIHYGDLGMQQFFDNIYHLLANPVSDTDSSTDDGHTVSYLILEPQPWKDYKQHQSYRHRLASMKFRPSAWQEWLHGEKGAGDAASEQPEIDENMEVDESRRREVKFAANGGFELVHTINAGDLDGLSWDVFIYRKRALVNHLKDVVE